MSETAAPKTYSAEYIAANRLQYNDVAEQDGTGTGYWYVEFDRQVETEGSQARGCACGCQLAVINPKRQFLPGHDQRLMGILARAHREGMEVAWIDGGLTISGDAMAYGELVLGETGVEKLARYLATEPKRTRKSTSAQRVTDPASADQLAGVAADPLPATVKVGRWEYPVTGVERDGNGEIVRVTYKNKRDEEVTVSTWGKLA